LYVRIFDPDLGGGGFADIDTRLPFPGGAFDTATTFSLYGGVGAYTHPNARQPVFTTTADPGIISGTLLYSRTFTQELAFDRQWVTIPITPTDGELVGDKFVFKLSVVGGPGDDGNIYNVNLSTSPDENITPQGARVLAYAWTFRLARPGTVPLYPYVTGSTATFTQNNFDFDHDTLPASMTVMTPLRSFTVTALSGDDETASSDHVVLIDESGSTWTVFCTTAEASYNNDVTLWITDQDGTPLAVFARSTLGPPP